MRIEIAFDFSSRDEAIISREQVRRLLNTLFDYFEHGNVDELKIHLSREIDRDDIGGRD